MEFNKFFKIDILKLVSFVLLALFFLGRYYSLGYSKVDILFIKIGYPIFMVAMAYILSCILGEVIKSSQGSKRLLGGSRKINVWEIIFTRLHLYIVLLLVIFLSVFLFGKTYGGSLAIFLPLLIGLIILIYWVYYRGAK